MSSGDKIELDANMHIRNSSRQSRASDSDNGILAAVSSWLEEKTVLPTKLKEEMDALKLLSTLDMQRNPDQRRRVYDTSCRLRHLHTTLLELAGVVEEEIGTFGVVRRKCGIALLPDEVIAMISELVFQSEYRRWKTAVKLSHLNRQFRSVVLSCPQLWTHMNSSSAMVSSCLPRTKGLPLTVVLMVNDNLSTGQRSFEPVVANILPLASRWYHLSLYFYSSSFERRSGDSIGQTLGPVNAPILEELYISYEDFDSERSPHWDWSQWNVPNLRHIKAVSYFPLSLPGLSNVTSLDITLPVEDEQMSLILAEISGMPQLRDLALELQNTLRDAPIVVYERIEFPQVRRLKLRDELHFRIKDFSPALKRSLFSSMFFPGLVDLELDIIGKDYTWELEEELHEDFTCDYYFNKEITRIFRHKEQFPRVENFRLEVFSPFDDHHDDENHTELSIPLNMLPNLKHFTLRSNTRLDIKEPVDPDEIVWADETRVAQRVVGGTLPVLQTVTLEMLDPSVVAEWLRNYFRELRDRELWAGFEELVVMEGREWDIDGRRKASYFGDRAIDWCVEFTTGMKARQNYNHQMYLIGLSEYGLSTQMRR